MASRRYFKAVRFNHTAASSNSRVSLVYETHRGQKHQKELSKNSNHNPIIFLHGFLGSKRENRTVSRLLARDLSRDVLAVDLRNHGESGHHPIHDYMAMALDVEAFIRFHKLKKVTLIGHSMGAKSALTLALRAPDLLSEVVAVDNGPIQLPIPLEFKKYLHALEVVKTAGIKTHAEAEQILPRYEESPIVRLWLLSNFIKDPKNLPYLKLRLPLETLRSAVAPLGDFPYAPSSSVKFERPTLFIRSHDSYYIPDRAVPLIRTFFPGSDLVDMACGHWIVQEQPEDFRRVVVNFLRRE